MKRTATIYFVDGSAMTRKLQVVSPIYKDTGVVFPFEGGTVFVPYTSIKYIETNTSKQTT